VRKVLLGSAVVAAVAALTAWNVTFSHALDEARAEYARGRYVNAAQHALDHLDRRPWSRGAAQVAARSLSMLDVPEEAEIYYQRAGRLSLDDLHLRAGAWVRSDHPEGARGVFQQILQRSPLDTTALRGLVGVELVLGNLEGAFQTAERLIAVPGGAVAGHALRGLASHEMTKRDEAVRDFECAFELNPSLSEMPLLPRVFWLDLAEDLVANGRAVDARRYLERAVKVAPDASLLTALGRAYQLEGNLDDAERALADAAAADTKDDLPHLHLGQIALQRNRLADAERLLRHALSLHARRYDTLYNLALVCRRLGRAADAEHWRLKAEAERSTSAAVSAAQPPPSHAL
jgi:tetratricopeptide (TPR) repeat protein